MARIEWDKTGERLFETGTKNGVLYPQDATGAYNKGVPWNGLTGVTESPSGAEPTAFWADDMKYATMMSAEEFGGTIEAYMYPDEFAPCIGYTEASKGVIIGQQKRSAFGFCYRTSIGNDVVGADYGYKLHLIYNALVSPSEIAYQSVNESPEANTLSFEFTTTPVNVTGHKPTALLTIDSTKVDAAKLAELESILYGSESEEPRLPLPDEVVTLFEDTQASG